MAAAQGSPRRLSRLARLFALICGCLTMNLTGCQSPYHSDRGALMGGLTGAGVGAAIGQAKGNTAAGAVVGSAVGALTGAAVGNELDVMEAKHEAMIEERLGQQRAAAATLDDAVAMTRAGVSEQVIMQHFRTHAVVRPPSVSELIMLKNEGVSDEVIRTLQEQSVQVPASPAYVRQVPVYVDHPYVRPCPPPYPHWSHAHWRAHRRRPGVSWGVSFGH